MVDTNALKAANAKRWANAKLTRGPEFVPVAKRLVATKTRYLAVEHATGVPWPFIAVTHQRESSQNWERSLAQGDPWNRVSTHVPAGRGPFGSWEAAAIDALVNCGPYAARNRDWSIAGTLTKLEEYNGLGYMRRGMPSPYVWSGTDQYSRGKYVRDGVFDPNEVDKQLGCAGLILAMMKLDPSIRFEDGPTSTPAGALRDGEWLQSSLNKLGTDPQLDVDGIVGPATRNAVRAFQLAQGLAVDGIAGPNTIAAIEVALAKGKPLPTIPVPPEITLPPPGTKARTDLAPTFWGRVFDLFRPKGN
ncbi:peptidoglycan-binding protein [Bradyrhizobium icense]|uniref:peptidoglycan-binding protein n=1 Tax=Bradyrhizobium icense TaxID=1274631 RepID=UPI000AF831B4|nr:peptidoglycan-binding protein [Bradyrhizobium icense]